MVQMPELCDKDSEAYKAGYKNIAEIGKERIRRVIKKMQDDDSVEQKIKDKLGFKVYKLQKSNYKEWKNVEETNLEQLETTFGEFDSPLVEGWKPENLLTEIQLIEGFPLDSKIQSLDEYKDNNVLSLRSDFYEHKLLVCLDKEVKETTIQSLSLNENDIFICLDNAITDQNKTRLIDKGMLKTI